MAVGDRNIERIRTIEIVVRRIGQAGLDSGGDSAWRTTDDQGAVRSITVDFRQRSTGDGIQNCARGGKLAVADMHRHRQIVEVRVRHGCGRWRRQKNRNIFGNCDRAGNVVNNGRIVRRSVNCDHDLVRGRGALIIGDDHVEHFVTHRTRRQSIHGIGGNLVIPVCYPVVAVDRVVLLGRHESSQRRANAAGYGVEMRDDRVGVRRIRIIKGEIIGQGKRAARDTRRCVDRSGVRYLKRLDNRISVYVNDGHRWRRNENVR